MRVPGDDLLEGFVGDGADGNQVAVDDEGGRLVDAGVLCELDLRGDLGLGSGCCGAGFHGGGVGSGGGHGAVKGLLGEFGRERFLVGKDLVNVGEEGSVTLGLCNAVAVRGALGGIGVDLDQREVLKNEVRTREVADQILDGYPAGYRAVFLLNASLTAFCVVVAAVMIHHKELVRGDEEALRRAARAIVQPGDKERGQEDDVAGQNIRLEELRSTHVSNEKHNES